tara:strand:+ start:1078 stop:1515 length:438 start_codon:yes stop_codon:yes gene_type:complete
MLNFFKNLKPKKLENEQNNELLTKTASLLIHAAKIDHEFTDKERRIIKKAIIDLGGNISTIDKLIVEAEINEKNSNQILSFTKEVKNTNHEFKTKIIEVLWKIIYSNNEADIYEANLMSRLSGLLYIDSKVMAEIKEKVKKNFSK